MKKIKIKKRYLIAAILTLFFLGFLVWYYREFEVLPAPAYYLLSDLPSPTANDRVLVISPHPDDETLGAGGFIDRAHDVGAQVEVVIATDGNRRGLKELRHEETIKAMAVFGITNDHIAFFDFPDGRLKAHQTEFKSVLEKQLTTFQPSIVLSTHKSDVHTDHTTVAEVVDQLVPTLKPRPVVYQFLVHYHRYPRPEGFRPTAFLLPPVKLISTSNPWMKFTLTEEEQTAKNEAVLQYKSQLSHKNPLLRGLLLSFVRQNELFVIEQQPMQ